MSLVRAATSNRSDSAEISDCGIYRIEVDRGEKAAAFYIGQSVRLKERLSTHRSRLRSGKHGNRALQSAFAKYGDSAVSMTVIARGPRDKIELCRLEQSALDAHIAEFGEDRIYNCQRDCVSSPVGVVRSAETRARISASLKGIRRTPEQIERMRLASTGKKLSEDSIAKRTAKQKGRVVSVETRAKHAAAQIGRQHSPEVRAKISASKKGQTPSAEHMERLRAIATGRTVSESTRAAIGAANSGRKKSPEEIAHRQATRAANRSV